MKIQPKQVERTSAGDLKRFERRCESGFDNLRFKFVSYGFAVYERHSPFAVVTIIR